MVPFSLFAPAAGRRPMCTLTPSVNLASSGAPLYRRKLRRQQTVNQRSLSAFLMEEIVDFFGRVPRDDSGKLILLRMADILHAAEVL